MKLGTVGRWLSILVLGSATTVVASCGGGNSANLFNPIGGDDASLDGANAGDSTPGPGDDGPTLLGDAPADGCVPGTCKSLGYTCGYAGDGCGGLLQCGKCTAPEFCGGGGFDKCGGNGGNGPDGAPACTPTTCAQLGYTCGPAGDGCGGMLACGTCASPQYCGGGGFSRCGGNNGQLPDGGNPCTPITCAQQNIGCGPAGDGCGGVLQCGTCNPPQTCGGGGPGQCGGTGGGDGGGPVCVPATCSSLGYTCGYAGDGCGNLLTCGTCTAPQYCGGGGFDQCGPAGVGTCPGGTATTLSGYVYDPGDNLPIYNALVYVPAGPIPTPQTGVNPPSCGCTAPPAYASAYTAIDGSFTLTNPPSGSSVTVVVQLGKWQRVFDLPITACQGNTLSAHLNLPSTRAQGNIPRFAVDTGAVDTLECVLLKMGIDPSEFVDPAIAGGAPTAAGRVHLYEGDAETGLAGTPNPAGGAIIDSNTPPEDALVESASVMDSYDVVLFPCKGGEATYDSSTGFPNALGDLHAYANAGGRVFTTHYSYVWLFTNNDFAGTATWTVNSGAWQGPFTGFVDQSFQRGQVLAQWLYQPAVAASTTFGQIPVNVIRNDFQGVVAPAQQWMYSTNPPDPTTISPMPIHYTFDTPLNATPECGRVVYSDFHVEDTNNVIVTGDPFPSECTGGGLTPQEKLLAFMLFDLTSCVGTPTCTPSTCAQQNIDCGPAGDGCGGMLQCGTCNSPQTCGGGGVPGQCGAPPDASACQPLTCAQQNIHCGPAGDGCGNEIMCGTCNPPQTCGGGGVPGQCGAPDAGSCTPETCAQQNIECGPAGDGCGNGIMCGTCNPPQTCGGGGVPGQCGYLDSGTCAPETCAQQKINCGPAGDGCGNEIMCGTCMAPQTCGGGGVPGQCGGGIQ